MTDQSQDLPDRPDATSPSGPPPAPQPPSFTKSPPQSSATPPPAYPPPPEYPPAYPPAYPSAPQAPAYGSGGYTVPARAPMAASDERMWAMLSHLAPFAGALVGLPFLGPLVVYLVFRDRGAFVRSQSAESLNFQITLLIGYVISAILIVILIGFFMLAALGIASIIFQIIAAVAANRGVDYRYPLTLRLVH